MAEIPTVEACALLYIVRASPSFLRCRKIQVLYHNFHQGFEVAARYRLGLGTGHGWDPFFLFGFDRCGF